MRGLEKASSRQPPVDPSSTSTLDLWWMLPSASVLARKHEERVQKAFSVDHHGPGDARLSHGAKPSLPPGMRLCGDSLETHTKSEGVSSD